jgi:HAE1 family hydrophobic/amphiphilic exporter-1
MSKFFINRPIVAMVISILMTIVGLVAMAGLPTAQFPNIVPPQINVSSTYTGADALTVEQAVATPIEQQMSGVDNMDYMYSINANNGQSTLYVNFALGTDANTDQLLAQMREGQAESQLPSDVRNYGVTVAKSTSSPLVMFALYSPNGTYDNVFLANYAYININDQMTRVKGIASVTVFGAGQYAMRLWVRPDQLAKLNITIPEIINAVNAQNTVNPAGTIGAEPVPPGQEFTYAVRAQGRWKMPRISATSCCAPTPTARSFASAMSPASNSAPRPTASRAGSTASRLLSSPSTRCLAPMPSTQRTAPRS